VLIKFLRRKKMANKKFLIGMLTIVLTFGMTVVGCGSDDDDSGNGGNNNGGGGGSGGTFTLTGIPSQYNGKYAGLSGTAGTSSNPIVLYGAQNINVATNSGTGVLISNGSVNLPMWKIIEGTSGNYSAVRYSGNDTATFAVVISNSAAPSETYLETVYFDSVSFSNGSATRTWSQGQQGTIE
jgi:hypothetical protein